MGVARLQILQLERNVVDAETGQRGYLLTKRPEYLKPYELALGSIDGHVRFLATHYSDEPQPLNTVNQLRDLLSTKLSELSEGLRLFNSGKTEAASELLLSDIGKEKMEDIRLLTAELLRFESANVKAGRKSVYDTLMRSRVGVAALCTLSLLALLMYLRQSLQLKKQQENLLLFTQGERERLEVEVRQRTAQLTELTQHLQTAREDERNRLARNLHDELGAILTAAKLDAARIKSRLTAMPVETSKDTLDLLAHLVGTLNNAIALGREIIEDLRPSALSNLGLVATLEIMMHDFADNSGIEVHNALVPVNLSASAELMIYRLVQEALTNIAKYAKATAVWLDLANEDGQVNVSIRDNGVGFDTQQKTRSAYGLMGMRYRVEAEGGALALRSAPGQGTTIEATLPALAS